MNSRLGKWMLGVIAVILLAGACSPVDAQVVVRVGPHHRRHHHRRHYHHHHR